MKRLINWFTDKFAPQKPVRQKSLHRSGVHRIPRPAKVAPVKPKPPAPAKVKYTAGVDGSIVDGGPGKNVLIRNKYLREDSGTHETLKIVDDSLLESEEEFGLDPYNTGRFDRSRTWDTSRFRK